MNSQDIARFDENDYKFWFPLLRTYSRFQKTLYDYSSKRMKSEQNQSLLTLYCPNLARSIFIGRESRTTDFGSITHKVSVKVNLAST